MAIALKSLSPNPSPQERGTIPEGLSVTERNGRASVSLTLRNDTVYVTALCDSLERQIEIYAELITRMQQKQELAEKFEQKKNGFQTMLNYFLAGAAVGCILTVLIAAGVNRIFRV
jgi:hypothetical protein